MNFRTSSGPSFARTAFGGGEQEMERGHPAPRSGGMLAPENPC
jgi:hypothetical protein